MSTSSVIKLYCNFHLGDSVYNLSAFFQINDYLTENNIQIHYFCKQQYHAQLAEFTPPSVILKPIEGAENNFQITQVVDGGLGGLAPLLHAGNQNLPKHLFNRPNSNFDEFYNVFFEQFIKMYNLAPPRIPTFYAPYDPNLLAHYDILPDKFKNLDILFINSPPLSGQYFKPNNSWDKFIMSTKNAGLKVATTAPLLRGYRATPPCTATAAAAPPLTIKSIAAISTHAKYIIAINTGPLAGCFNEITMNYIVCMWVFDRGNTFAHPKVHSCDKIENINLPIIHTPRPRRKMFM
jgi:hypothetical protein